jgi:hypothetical protein
MFTTLAVMEARVRAAVPVGRRAGVAGALASPVVLAAIALARHAGLSITARDVASSPAGVASGKVWSLVTSALVVAGPPLPQVLEVAVLAVAASVLVGPAFFWSAAVAGHIGATLVAYAGIGVLWLVARGDVDDIVHAPDYGISCASVGVLGALVAAAPLPRAARTASLAGLIGFAAAVVVSDDLAAWEHLIAFALGCAVGLRSRTFRPSPAAAWLGDRLWETTRRSR